MCGFLGVAGVKTYNNDYFSKVLDELIQRGPNQKGIIAMEGGRVILGHRRLSIHDLSEASKQPFVSEDKSRLLVFNGEIYNFLSLKKELEGHGEVFSTSSDTEVLFKLLNIYTIDDVLNKIEGMYAFSYINLITRKIYLVRDRFGEKPLAYSLCNGQLYFGSEVTPVAKLIKSEGHEIDIQALSDFIHYGYIKNSNCIIQGVKKVKPATYIEFELNKLGVVLNKECEYYINSKCKVSESYIERKKTLKELIKSSIHDCLESDVPVGCFLSGGVDSSLVASIASKYSRNIKTYCIGFDENDYDESTYAKNIAKYLGTEHYEIKLSLSNLASIFMEKNRIYDEPFADASFLATYAVCKYAKNNITVSLTGDGADELFCGYNRHVSIPILFTRLSKIPHSLRCVFSSLIGNRLSVKIISLINSRLPSKIKLFNCEEKLEKLANLLKQKNVSDIFTAVLVSDDVHRILNLPKPTNINVSNDVTPADLAFCDMKNYLNEDVLVKVDRAAMAVSLETRAPFLNSRIACFSSSLPLSDKIGKLGQKNILKDILFDYVPPSFFDRKKSGFSVPYGKLIDHHLKDFIEGEIKKIEARALTFDFSLIFNLVSRYYSDSYKDKKIIWNIFCLVLWVSNNIDLISRDGESK